MGKGVSQAKNDLDHGGKNGTLVAVSWTSKMVGNKGGGGGGRGGVPMQARVVESIQRGAVMLVSLSNLHRRNGPFKKSVGKRAVTNAWWEEEEECAFQQYTARKHTHTHTHTHTVHSV